MKDLPHHMKKLNRKVIRSEHRLLESDIEIAEEELVKIEMTQSQRPKEQIRKQFKEEMRLETQSHIPEIPTIEERNRKMKHRVPIFDRTSHPRLKKGANPKKKTPPV